MSTQINASDYTQTCMFTDYEYFLASQINFDICVAYYHDQGDSAYHRYYCGDINCQYCYAIGFTLHTYKNVTVEDLISYEKFVEVFPDPIDFKTRLCYDRYASEYLPMMENAYYEEDSSDSDYSEDSSDNNYSEDNDDYDNEYSDYDTDQYQYGFTPEPDIDCAVFDDNVFDAIDYDKLTVVGAGIYGVVLTDGTYAIKVGEINSGTYHRLTEGYKAGFCVPGYFYDRQVVVDSRIIAVLKDSTFYSNGSPATYEQYVSYYGDNEYRADVMVMGCAEPFIDQNDCDYDEVEEAHAVAAKCAEEYCAATGKCWSDAHGYNIGFYKGAVIILDI